MAISTVCFFLFFIRRRMIQWSRCPVMHGFVMESVQNVFPTQATVLLSWLQLKLVVVCAKKNVILIHPLNFSWKLPSNCMPKHIDAFSCLSLTACCEYRVYVYTYMNSMCLLTSENNEPSLLQTCKKHWGMVYVMLIDCRRTAWYAKPDVNKCSLNIVIFLVATMGFIKKL